MTGASDPADPGEAPSLVSIQREVLAYWERTGVPGLAMAGGADGPEFRFTEGPPTANGRPHLGHLLARAIKDTIVRYRRLRGDRIVTPMAGWDCHGLPVELEVEKRHHLKSKKEIESFGVERFCEECRRSTLEVADVWREMSRQLGYWLDYDHAYYTMSPTYIESVWWSLRRLFDAGLLEKGHYVLPYCPRCETPLSSHEVAQGYRETTDPSVTIRLDLERPPGAPRRSLLVWTTTPWTLPANLLVAARADLPYVVVREADGSESVLAEGALGRYYPTPPTIAERLEGRALAGATYLPAFAFAGPGAKRYRIVLDDMVDASEGTGLVHIAPSFGPDDQRIGAREGVGVWDPLDSRGVFTDAVPPVEGKAFKSADPILVEQLRETGHLVSVSHLKHTYPFCWRCSNPLLYRAIDSWFVRTSRFTQELVANNATVRWIPAHLREGRFGNFLTEAKDWALSRNRYWGTPLPIWACPKAHFTCLGSFAELAERSGAPLPPGFDPHRVSVDKIVLPCPTCGEPARREPYTIDGWYDSGSAPFAQYHYPFEPGPFDPGRPLDFIAEGLDQTRGWFYTLLVLATSLFHRPAYRACVVNGLVLDESGQKMSKSKGNVTDPLDLLERQGADAARWAFFSTDFTEPWKATEDSVRHTAARTLGTLLHVLSFYQENALADGLTPARARPHPERALDRWLLSRLEGTRLAVTASLDGFDPRPAVAALRELVDDLSTWYLRRSRPRFWGEGSGSDRQAANDTLSFVLLTLAGLLAPIAPFLAEHVHQRLQPQGFASPEGSVHLAGWPEAPGAAEPDLEQAMAALRAEVERGRELRHRAGVKARIPLQTFLRSGESAKESEGLGAEGIELLREELNVRSVETVPDERLAGLSETDWVLERTGAKARCAISRQPTEELRREGLLRESLRRLQAARKEQRLAYTDHVALVVYASGDLAEVLRAARDRIARELLADEVDIRSAPAPEDPAIRRWELDGVTFAAQLTPRAGPSARAA